MRERAVALETTTRFDHVQAGDEFPILYTSPLQ
jgi:hypothetical protein